MRTQLALVALGALLLAPAAAAHTTYLTPDGAHRIVVGNLNEPVYTFVKTGLDLCFQQNTTAREPVTVEHAALRAVLTAPSGAELEQPLRTQFGRAGCYTFEEGYVLTEPGQYVLHLTGPVGASQVDARINVAGPVDDSSGITFPAKGVPSALDLQDSMEDVADGQTNLWIGIAAVAVAGAIAIAVVGRRR